MAPSKASVLVNPVGLYLAVGSGGLVQVTDPANEAAGGGSVATVTQLKIDPFPPYNATYKGQKPALETGTFCVAGVPSANEPWNVSLPFALITTLPKLTPRSFVALRINVYFP